MQLKAKARSLVHATPAQVFDAFVNPATMRQFWFHRVDQGLKENETVTWYLGESKDAYGFPVRVIALQANTLIHVRWGEDGSTTDVHWHLEKTGESETILTIEESGFTGTDAEIIARALDSTGGFNQVIVAVKALLEHGVAINLVRDHV